VTVCCCAACWWDLLVSKLATVLQLQGAVPLHVLCTAVALIATCLLGCCAQPPVGDAAGRECRMFNAPTTPCTCLPTAVGSAVLLVGRDFQQLPAVFAVWIQGMCGHHE
jgi:hypothetical protein